ncbi:hypothetical protein D9757_007294 [Collybiopsis confluens]|uniref:Uncharacterized protein n=1 Tax=Collybiopsis confluens TaxID=2823264 RepID=A0A8H5M6U8_9AGAR|nr:hypothetical protein D9757_007294 [Collybiopsis confluens]
MSYSRPAYPPPQQVYSGSSTGSAQSSNAAAKSTGFKLTRDADILISTYIPAATSTEVPPYRPDDVPRLLPLCIPRLSVSADPASAFARGYNPALETVGITQEMFVSFIDGLNLAIVASPPLRVVNLAGQIIGFVPYHWAMIASIAITTGAQVGSRVLSKTLTDRYLRAANRNIFKPRGLSVRLCTTPAMLRLVAPPGSQSGSGETSKTRETANKIGRGVSTVILKLPIPIVGPIAQRIIHAVADKPPPVAPSGNSGDPINSPTLMRRLALLEHTFPGATLPVYTQGIPPPAKPQGAMEIINSWGLKLDAYKDNKKEKRNEERRRAWAQIQAAGVATGDYPYNDRRGPRRPISPSRSPRPGPMAMPTPMVGGGATGMSYSDGYMPDHRTARRAEREAYQTERKAYQTERKAYQTERKAYRKMEKGQRKSLITGMSKAEQRVANADLLEHWTTSNVLWIVVMPSVKDEVIADIEIAENVENEEQVDEKMWGMAMKLEKDQLEEDVESEEEWEDELAMDDAQRASSSSQLLPPKSS